jgi:hypothetical protein
MVLLCHVKKTAPDEKPATAKPKIKAGPRGPATKAEHAALKRVDKMIIKRMRKR